MERDITFENKKRRLSAHAREKILIAAFPRRITCDRARSKSGVKYLRFMMDQYFKDAKMDRVNRGLFAFASYNAGPNRIAQLRKQAAAEGLDANRWFNNVELVAAREIGPETVTYVSNIYKYYVAYKLVSAHPTGARGLVPRPLPCRGSALVLYFLNLQNCLVKYWLHFRRGLASLRSITDGQVAEPKQSIRTTRGPRPKGRP
jgi:hypothetical protein